MKTWKDSRSDAELALIKELKELNSDIRLVRKNKKANYQRNKKILSKKANYLQELLQGLSEHRRNSHPINEQ